MDGPEPSEDVDLALRHISRLFPDQFARALLPAGSAITVKGWLDTQVTSRQRRLDRALDVEVNGERRMLHAEWQLGMKADVPFRLYEYHVMLALALSDETPVGEKVPLIESTLVLLSGREEPWPEQGELRTSPLDAPYCGVGFRIEAVYQQTLAQIAEKGSPLWLIFAPLAVDAAPERMEQVVEKLRAESTPRQFEELAVALAVMADADKRERGLREVIVALLDEEIIMESWVYKQGIEKGIEKGIERGIGRGVEKVLGTQLQRRLGRRLDESEQVTLVERIEALGADRLSEVVLELSPEQLAAWLRDPDAR